MKHVAMIVSNPCDPDPRVEKEAAALTEAGYKVTIHAFDRDENKKEKVLQNDVEIIRYRIGKTPTGAPTILTGSKVLFGLRKFRKTVLNELLKTEPEVIHCHDADTLAIGISLKKKLRTTLVFDLHDLAHTWARMSKPYSIVRRLISKVIEIRLVRRMKLCDLIITSSGSVAGTSHQGFREWVKKRVKKANVAVVENRPERIDTILPLPEHFTIGYAGKIREKTMFKTLIQAAENMSRDIPVKLIVAGHGTANDEVEKMLEHTSIEVEKTGKFQTNELSDIINRMSVMYAVYPTTRGNILDGALPTKMFDAAIHGRPSIVNSDCLMGDIAKSEKIGITVDSGDISELTSALIEIERRNKIIKLERDWSGEARRLVSAYSSIGNGS